MARQWIACGGWRRVKHRIILLLGTVWLAAFASSGSARANVAVDVNNALLNIIQNTSAALVDGPPEVAREIALIDGAMFDAMNAASGSPYPPIVYQGGPVAGDGGQADEADAEHDDDGDADDGDDDAEHDAAGGDEGRADGAVVDRRHHRVDGVKGSS